MCYFLFVNYNNGKAGFILDQKQSVPSTKMRTMMKRYIKALNKRNYF